MASSWTPERKERQAVLIRTWQPWKRSSGPRSAEGKAAVAKNAYKGGHWLELRKLSRLVNAEIKEARDLAARVTL